MVLVKKAAPEFTAKAAIGGKIVENFSLSFYSGSNVLLLFYPLDFTFVCPTEIISFQEKSDEFEETGTKVVAISVDSVYSHLAWLSTPRAQGGIEGVSFPIVSDITKEISRQYGVLLPEEGISLRALFLIDPSGIIRHQSINDLPIGRSVDEALRIIEAVNYHTEHGDVCPANWKPGAKALKASKQGIEEYFAGFASK